MVTWVYKEDVSRFLDPQRFNPDRDLTPREDIWYLRGLAVELKLQDTAPLKFAQIFAQYPKSANDDINENFKDEMHKAFDNLITSMMWGLCPRLDFASVNLEDGQEIQRLKSLLIESFNLTPATRTVYCNQFAKPARFSIISQFHSVYWVLRRLHIRNSGCFELCIFTLCGAKAN